MHIVRYDNLGGGMGGLIQVKGAVFKVAFDL